MHMIYTGRVIIALLIAYVAGGGVADLEVIAIKRIDFVFFAKPI